MTAPRVVTLTLSPALDTATSVGVVVPDRKLRCAPPTDEPGGGGINVARVVRRLGADARAVAPLGGDRGRQLVDDLAAEGVVVEAIDIDQPIRQSFSVTEETTGRQFRFVLPATTLDHDAVQRCLDAVSTLGADAGCVVVSGRIPGDDHARLFAELVDGAGTTPVVVDTSGDALRSAVACGAALVKPSARELAELVGRTLDSEDEVTDAAIEIVAGAQVGALLVSIGAGGAILARTGLAPLRFRAPTVQVRSTIGAGDSLVGGIAMGLARGDDLVDAIGLGIAAGTATVMSDGTALCDPANIEALLPLVVTDEIPR